MTPSDATRHSALEVADRAEDDADFDFLSQRRSNKFNWNLFRWSWRITLSLLFLLVLILLAVDVSTRKEKSNGEWMLSSGRCLFPLGGGETNQGGALRQPSISHSCIDLFKDYFQDDGQYWKDTLRAIDEAEGLLEMKGNNSHMVILDIDETSLSNLPLYQKYDFVPDAEQRAEWFGRAEAVVIPATLQLYKNLRRKGFSVSFLTGRREENRNGTVMNLSKAGYGSQCQKDAKSDDLCYHALILRSDDDDRDALVYKTAERKKLSSEGFEVVASIGDQWSDLLGDQRPSIIIKMPNPLYYLP